METGFSAKAQKLGYLYQVRYSLLLLLKAEEEARLSIESLDDIVFNAEDGEPKELLQLKHSVRKQATLTDRGPELWKTLRIWADAVSQQSVDLEHIILTLICTGSVRNNPDTALFLLKPGSTRNPKLASNILEKIASTSSNKQLRPAHNAFLQLTSTQQEQLLGRINIIDSSPNIENVSQNIMRYLELSVRPAHRNALYERIEGWWFNKVIHHLMKSESDTISRLELHAQIRDIAEQFTPDALPIDFLDAEPPETPDPTTDERMFVVQLREIALQNNYIEKAIRDYYRAVEQRSRWVREDLLFGDELEKYEQRLIDEWERVSMQTQEEVSAADSSEDALKTCGKRIFYYIEKQGIPIRSNVHEPYIMRGSYHILANEQKPRVWWHPEFLRRLEALLLLE